MRIVVGLLLLVASGFKVWDYLAGYINVSENLGQRNEIWESLTSAVEATLGMFVLTGPDWRVLRIPIASMFFGFAGYSLYLALQGADSCGCFGPIKVNPWWTFLLDLSVLIGLLIDWRINKNSDPSPGGYPLKFRLTSVALTIALFCVILVWQSRPAIGTAHSLLQVVGDTTILEPKNWVGKPFPLIDDIDLDLRQGNWIVVLHRHDCADCQKALPNYERLAHKQSDSRVVLVEVPPFAKKQEERECPVARLADNRQWFVQTPVEIRLEKGLVMAASTELPGIGGRKSHPARNDAFQEQFEQE